MSLSPESDIVAFGVDSRDVMANYRHIVRRRAIMLLLLTLLIVASLLLDFVMGPSGLSLQALWQTLTDPASASAGTRAIVWDIRMPYALMAIVVGLALGWPGRKCRPSSTIRWPARLRSASPRRRRSARRWLSCWG
jgi:iron complex transport system permease protein